jgi:hypothetical protein
MFGFPTALSGETFAKGGLFSASWENRQGPSILLTSGKSSRIASSYLVRESDQKEQKASLPSSCA